MTKTEPKLVVVFSRFNLKLFEVLSNEITELNVPEMHFEKHHRPERHEGHYQRRSDPMGRFEPHTTADDIEYHDGAKIVADYLNSLLGEDNKWKELIVVCDPKALGYFRQVAGNNVQKHVTQTINKNIVNFEANEIKKIIAEALAV